jgi:Flp pilus assembly CpaF family ATPase
MSFELILPFFRPIERLLLDDTVSEIMGNPDGVWWFETRGQLACAEGVRFDPKALIAGLEVIANYLGKKLGEPAGGGSTTGCSPRAGSDYTQVSPEAVHDRGTN